MSAPLTLAAACIADETVAPPEGLARFSVDLECWTSLTIVIDAADEDHARDFADKLAQRCGEDPFEFVHAGFDIGEVNQIDPPVASVTSDVVNGGAQ